MTPEETRRLTQLKRYEEKGQYFFGLIQTFYENEELLNIEDIIERSETTLRIRYARRQYLIEATYNEQNGYGQLKTYEARSGTEFWPYPEFIHKASVNIFYDSSGNIYIGGQAAHMNPDQSAEAIIKEIVK